MCLEMVFIPSHTHTHTERFAAFVMIGCVKHNAMISGVSVTHNCKINLRNSNEEFEISAVKLDPLSVGEHVL